MSFKELSKSTIWKNGQREKSIVTYLSFIKFLGIRKLSRVYGLWENYGSVWSKVRQETLNGDGISGRRLLLIWLLRNWVYCRNKHLNK